MPVKDEEARAAIAAIREEMAHRDDRLDMLEKMLTAHLTVCNRQQEELQQILEVVRNVNASLKVANILRRAFIWVAGLATAAWSLWHTFRGQ